MAAKTSPEIRENILKLWGRAGYTKAELARCFGLSVDTIHKIVDPEYAARRQKQIAAAHKRNPPPTYGKKYRRQSPSLAKV